MSSFALNQNFGGITSAQLASIGTGLRHKNALQNVIGIGGPDMYLHNASVARARQEEERVRAERWQAAQVRHMEEIDAARAKQEEALAEEKRDREYDAAKFGVTQSGVATRHAEDLDFRKAEAARKAAEQPSMAEQVAGTTLAERQRQEALRRAEEAVRLMPGKTWPKGDRPAFSDAAKKEEAGFRSERRADERVDQAREREGRIKKHQGWRQGVVERNFVYQRDQDALDRATRALLAKAKLNAEFHKEVSGFIQDVNREAANEFSPLGEELEQLHDAKAKEARIEREILSRVGMANKLAPRMPVEIPTELPKSPIEAPQDAPENPLAVNSEFVREASKSIQAETTKEGLDEILADLKDPNAPFEPEERRQLMAELTSRYVQILVGPIAPVPSIGAGAVR